jgi:uncharacterized HAD superfamily protein
MRIDWFIESHEEAWLKVSRRQPIELRQVEAVAEQMTLARAVAPVAETRRGGAAMGTDRTVCR